MLVDYVHAVEEASARVMRLDKDIAQLVESWSLKPLVQALQGLRGVRLLTAVVLAAELGDMARFAKPAQLMGYLGLVPSEHSSGESTKRGGITRTGNTHVRRVVVESAWAYRFKPAPGPRLRKRNEPLSQPVRAIAWKAQLRLHGRYARMLARGKNKQQTVTAVAPELAGFVWAIAHQNELLAASNRWDVAVSGQTHAPTRQPSTFLWDTRPGGATPATRPRKPTTSARLLRQSVSGSEDLSDLD